MRFHHQGKAKHTHITSKPAAAAAVSSPAKDCSVCKGEKGGGKRKNKIRRKERIRPILRKGKHDQKEEKCARGLVGLSFLHMNKSQAPQNTNIKIQKDTSNCVWFFSSRVIPLLRDRICPKLRACRQPNLCRVLLFLLLLLLSKEVEEGGL
jgi:hypothetical protein